MAKRKKKSRVSGSYTVTAELLEFEGAIVAKCRERGLEGGAQIPKELVDEVVQELYGGWTDQARSFVRIIERKR